MPTRDIERMSRREPVPCAVMRMTMSSLKPNHAVGSVAAQRLNRDEDRRRDDVGCDVVNERYFRGSLLHVDWHIGSAAREDEREDNRTQTGSRTADEREDEPDDRKDTGAGCREDAVLHHRERRWHIEMRVAIRGASATNQRRGGERRQERQAPE